MKENIKEVSVIQYNKKKCYGQNSSNLLGKMWNIPIWSSLDLRPGYYSEGNYNTG